MQSALREAANYGLLGIRRRRYAPSVITILKDEWKDWLKTSSSTPRKALEMKDILDPPKGAKMCDSEPEESPPAKVVAVAEIVEEPIPDSVPAQAPQEPAEPDVLALAKTAFDRRLDALLAKVEPVRPGPAPVEESYNPNLSEVITLCGSWKNAWGYVEDLSPARYPKVYEKPAYTGHRTGIRQEVRDWLTQRHGGEWSIKSAFAEDGLRRILLGLGHHSHAVEFRMRWSGR
ncbi:hypothetical protein E4V01_15600 [Methylorubrum sp. Q1]|nr:hypothetical protein E4V01_15600 [Methylorubrum sp. Q1]